MASGCKDEGFLRVCYYRWEEELKPDFIDTSFCTHLIMGFTVVTDGVLHPGETGGPESYSAITKLKERDPKLKVMLSVGGGGNNDGFSTMVSCEENRQKFIDSVISTLCEFNFDGLDIDWEFPAWGGSPSADKKNFVLFLKQLRGAFDNIGASRASGPFIFSVAVAAPSVIVSSSYDVPELAKLVDFVNLMTYDFHLHKWYFPFTGHNSPLHKRKSELGYYGTLNMEAAAQLWVSKGMPKSKLVIGVPTYGLSWRLATKHSHGIFAPSSGKGSQGGYVTYPQVCAFLRSGAERKFDHDSKVPYAYKNCDWISYDDEESIALKVKWIKSSNFAGVMTFSLNCDDWRGQESNVLFPLHKKIYQTVTEM